MTKVQVDYPKLIKKIIFSLLILFGITLSLFGVTYAWYSISVVPEIKQIKVSMVSTSNFEIARATDDHTPPQEVGINDEALGDITWGQSISFSNARLEVDGMATVGNFPYGNDMATATYDDTGRTAGYKSLTSTEMGAGVPQGNVKMFARSLYAAANELGDPVSEPEEEADRGALPTDGVKYYKDEDSGKTLAVGLGFWIRTNRSDADLSIFIDGVSAKSGSGEDLGTDVVGMAFRNGKNGAIKEASRNAEGEFGINLSDKPIEGGKPQFVEMIVYIEGEGNDIGGKGAVAGTVSHGVGIAMTSSSISTRKIIDEKFPEITPDRPILAVNDVKFVKLANNSLAVSYYVPAGSADAGHAIYINNDQNGTTFKEGTQLAASSLNDTAGSTRTLTVFDAELIYSTSGNQELRYNTGTFKGFSIVPQRNGIDVAPSARNDLDMWITVSEKTEEDTSLIVRSIPSPDSDTAKIIYMEDIQPGTYTILIKNNQNSSVKYNKLVAASYYKSQSLSMSNWDDALDYEYKIIRSDTTVVDDKNASIEFVTVRDWTPLKDTPEEKVIGEVSGVILDYANPNVSTNWTLNSEGVLTISYGTASTLMPTYNGSYLPMIMPWYEKYRSSITKVVIEDGIEWISCLRGLKNLTEVELPDSANTIMKGCFSHCSSLKTINGLENIKSIENSAFEYSAIEEFVASSELSSLDYSAFAWCSSLKSVDLSLSAIKSLRFNMFNGCTSLNSVILNDISSIESSCFRECSSLYQIDIPDSVQTIESNAFDGCIKLKSVELPDGLISLGEQCFSGCTELSSVLIPYGITEIGFYTFKDCKALTSLVIPDSVVTLGSSVFSGCSNLADITMSKNVEEIPSNAFRGCPLTTFRIAADHKLKKIHGYAFYGCKFESFAIPEGVTMVGDYAFSGMNDTLTKIEFPSTVVSIGNNVLYFDVKLTELVVPKGSYAESFFSTQDEFKNKLKYPDNGPTTKT